MTKLLLILALLGADLPPPSDYCPPYWQCNGSKETNHPNCKCWDIR